MASQEWDSITTLLADTGNLSVVDGASLAIYCQAFARYLEAERHLSEHGLMVVSPNGYELQSPWVAVARQYERTMLTILNQFGLNPRSRKAIKPGEKKPAASPMARLLKAV